MSKRTLGSALVALLLGMLPARALAGGLFLSDRGVRPLGRGGAFVAGADDPNALWYNPAGLAHAKRQLFFDSTLVLLDGEYLRLQADGAPYQVGPNGGGYPTVEASHPPLPIPMLAYVDSFGLRDFSFGIGVFAQNQVVLEWPSEVSVDGMPGYPAPQRYSLLSLEGSLLATNALGVAWHGVPHLSIGATAQLIAGRLRTRSVLSGCDGTVCAFSESPGDDVYGTVELSPAVALSGSLGVIYEISEAMRVGASLDLPYALSGEGTVDLTLPNGPTYAEARVLGDRVDLTLEFPWHARVGFELRPLDALRVELSYVLEGWAGHDAVKVEPRDVQLQNVLGIGDYDVGPIAPEHTMRNTHSVRLGGEYAFPEHGLTLRGGAMFETGAFPDSSLSAFTLDSDKLILAAGLGYALTERFIVDAMLAHGFMRNREVRDSEVTQPNGVRPVQDAPVVANGNYAMEANFVGLGARFLLD